MDELLAVEDDGNHCYGCSPTNPHGLGLRFVRTGPRRVVCRYVVPQHLCGSPAVVHGGVQATLLDEAMGWAVRQVAPPGRQIVTAELSVRYRRPVPVGQPLEIRAEVTRDDQFVVRVEAGIHVMPPTATTGGPTGGVSGDDGNPDEVPASTTATAVWRVLD